MALQLYTTAEIYVDGAKLTEEAQIAVNRKTNSQAVTTAAKGYAGESPGAPTTEITVTNAVPGADFELNPGPFMQQLKVKEFTFFAAGRTLTFKGFMIEDNFTHAVNTESKLEFRARGEFADWK
jgi:hypothetical protein